MDSLVRNCGFVNLVWRKNICHSHSIIKFCSFFHWYTNISSVYLPLIEYAFFWYLFFPFLFSSQVGEFYEAIGIDACVLVEYAGLNPFGGLRSDSTPRAGCPVVVLTFLFVYMLCIIYLCWQTSNFYSGALIGYTYFLQ